VHDPIQQLGLINHEKYSLKENDKLFLGEGSHKIKKKAEQISCRDAIEVLRNYT